MEEKKKKPDRTTRSRFPRKSPWISLRCPASEFVYFFFFLPSPRIIFARYTPRKGTNRSEITIVFNGIETERQKINKPLLLECFPFLLRFCRLFRKLRRKCKKQLLPVARYEMLSADVIHLKSKRYSR